MFPVFAIMNQGRRKWGQAAFLEVVHDIHRRQQGGSQVLLLRREDMTLTCVTKRPLLLMRGAFFFVTCIIAMAIVLGLSYAEPAPSPPPTLPSEARWICDGVTRYPDSRIAKVREVFVSDGKRWRLEFRTIHGKIHVAIYDGRTFATSLRRKVEASDLDPRVVLRIAYGLIPESKYLGTVRIRGSKCWHYSRKEGAEELQLWIDTERQIPRKVRMKYQDGEIIEQEYLDLPDDIVVSPDLFDITDLRIRILNHIPLDFTR
jgi:hypothetical protein